MTLWRISNYSELKGLGGLRTPGRWHNRGIAVVYLAESPALAMLEVLVHVEMEPSEVPDTYQLLKIDFQGRKGVSRLDTTRLPDNWAEDIEYTRSVGDEWLRSFSSTLLKVPSAIVPNSANYLLTPQHELAGNAKICNATKHPFDSRFLQ